MKSKHDTFHLLYSKNGLSFNKNGLSFSKKIPQNVSEWCTIYEFQIMSSPVISGEDLLESGICLFLLFWLCVACVIIMIYVYTCIRDVNDNHSLIKSNLTD